MISSFSISVIGLDLMLRSASDSPGRESSYCPNFKKLITNLVYLERVKRNTSNHKLTDTLGSQSHRAWIEIYSVGLSNEFVPECRNMCVDNGREVSTVQKTLEDSDHGIQHDMRVDQDNVSPGMET